MRLLPKSLLAACLILLACLPGVSGAESESGRALIYNGTYADADSAEAIAALARRAGLQPVYFVDPGELAGRLQSAVLVAVGGTVDDIDPFIASFTPAVTRALKDFINRGGTYLGICGGAYIASAGWREEGAFVKALGLVPVETDSYSSEAAPRIIDVLWKNEKRPVYYQFGPKFLLPKGEDAGIIARYDDRSIAALLMTVGKGKVYLVGPHPEADDTWIEDDVRNAGRWKSTADLAVDVLRDALSR